MMRSTDRIITRSVVTVVSLQMIDQTDLRYATAPLRSTKTVEQAHSRAVRNPGDKGPL
jgi:hypothetical protein